MIISSIHMHSENLKIWTKDLRPNEERAPLKPAMVEVLGCLAFVCSNPCSSLLGGLCGRKNPTIVPWPWGLSVHARALCE